MLAESVVATLRLVAIDEVSGPAYAAARAVQSVGVASDTAGGGIGKAATMAGFLGAALGGAALKSAMDFQKSIQIVGGNTGMTAAQMQQLSKNTLELGKTFPVSLDQITQAEMRTSNAGFALGGQMNTVVTAALKSASVAMADAGDVANALAHQLNVWGVGATSAAAHGKNYNSVVYSMIDAIHAAAAASNMTLDQFARVVSQVSVVAKIAGFSIKDTFGAIGALTRTGMSPAQAATQVRGLFQSIAAPLPNAQKQVQALSDRLGELNVRADNGTMVQTTLANAFTQQGVAQLGLTGFLNVTQQAFHGNLEEMRAAVPATRGMIGLAALQGTGFNDLTQIMNKMSAAQTGVGLTQKQWNDYTHTALYQFGIFKNQVQETAIALGGALLPAFSAVMGFLNPLIQGLSNWIQHNNGAAASIVKFAIGLGAIALAIGALHSILSPLMIGFEILGKAIMLPFTPIVAGYNSMAASVGRLTAAFTTENLLAFGGTLKSVGGLTNVFKSGIDASAGGAAALYKRTVPLAESAGRRAKPVTSRVSTGFVDQKALIAEEQAYRAHGQKIMDMENNLAHRRNMMPSAIMGNQSKTAEMALISQEIDKLKRQEVDMLVHLRAGIAKNTTGFFGEIGVMAANADTRLRGIGTRIKEIGSYAFAGPKAMLSGLLEPARALIAPLGGVTLKLRELATASAFKFFTFPAASLAGIGAANSAFSAGMKRSAELELETKKLSESTQKLAEKDKLLASAAQEATDAETKLNDAKSAGIKADIDEARAEKKLADERLASARSEKAAASRDVNVGTKRVDEIKAERPSGVMGAFSNMGEHTAQLKLRFEELGPVISKVLAPVRLLGAAFTMSLGPITMLLGPIAMLGGALIALAGVGILFVAWKKDWGGIRETVHGAIATVKADLNDLMAFMTQVFNALAPLVMPAIRGMANAFGQVVSAIKNIISPAQAVGGAIDHMGRTMNSANQPIKTMIGGFNSVQDAVNAVVGVLKGPIISAFTFLQQVFTELAEYISSHTSQIRSQFDQMGSSIQQVMNAFKTAGTAIVGAVSQIISAFQGVGKGSDDAHSKGAQFGNFLGGTLLGILKVVTAAVKLYADYLTALAGVISKVVDQGIRLGIFKDIGNIIQTSIKYFQDFVGIVQTVWNWLKLLADDLGGFFKDNSQAFGAAWDMITQSFQRVGETLGRVMTTLQDAFSTFFSIFDSGGKKTKDAGNSATTFANILGTTLLVAVQLVASSLDILTRIIAFLADSIVGFIRILADFAKLFADVFTNLTKIVGDFVTVFTDIFAHPDRILGDLQKLGWDIWNFFKSLVSDIWKIFSDGFQTITQMISDLFGTMLTDLVVMVLKKVKDMISAFDSWPLGIGEAAKAGERALQAQLNQMTLDSKKGGAAAADAWGTSFNGLMKGLKPVVPLPSSESGTMFDLGSGTAKSPTKKNNQQQKDVGVGQGGSFGNGYVKGVTDALSPLTTQMMNQNANTFAQLDAQVVAAGARHGKAYTDAFTAAAKAGGAMAKSITDGIVPSMESAGFLAGQTWSQKFMTGLRSGNQIGKGLKEALAEGFKGQGLTDFLAGASGKSAYTKIGPATQGYEDITNKSIPDLAKKLETAPPSIRNALLPGLEALAGQSRTINLEHENGLIRINKAHTDAYANAGTLVVQATQRVNDAYIAQLKTFNTNSASSLKADQKKISDIQGNMAKKGTSQSDEAKLSKDLAAAQTKFQKDSTKFNADFAKITNAHPGKLQSAIDTANTKADTMRRNADKTAQNALDSLHTREVTQINSLNGAFIAYANKVSTAMAPEKIWDAIQKAASDKLTNAVKVMSLGLTTGNKSQVAGAEKEMQKFGVVVANQSIALGKSNIALAEATGKLSDWQKGISDTTVALQQGLVAGTASATSKWTHGIETMLKSQNDAYNKAAVKSGLYDAEIGKATDNLKLWQDGLKAASTALRDNLILGLLKSGTVNETNLQTLIKVTAQQKAQSDATEKLDAAIALATGDFTTLDSALKKVAVTAEGKLVASFIKTGEINDAALDKLAKLAIAQQKLTVATDTVSLAVAIASGSIKNIDSAVQGLTTELQDQFLTTIITGKGNIDDAMTALQGLAIVTNDVAELQAGSAITIGQSTGNFDMFNKGLTDAAKIFQNDIMSTFMRGSTSISASFNSLMDLSSIQEHVTQVTDAFGAKLALATGNVSGFISAIGSLLTTYTNAFAKDSLAGNNTTGDISKILELSQAQSIGTQVMLGLNTQVALATNNFTELGKNIGQNLTDSTEAWRSELLRTGETTNAYSDQVIKATQLQSTWNTLTDQSNVALGLMTGDVGVFISGLSGLFSVATTAMTEFLAGIAPVGTSLVTLTSSALDAANSLVGLPDIIKSIGTVVTGIQTQAETDFYRTGSITPGDSKAFINAKNADANANFGKAGGDLALARDAIDPQSALTAVTEIQQGIYSKFLTAVGTYGVDSPQARELGQSYKNATAEVKGITDVLKISKGDTSGLTRADINNAHTMWNELLAGADPASKALKAYFTPVPGGKPPVPQKSAIQQAQDDIKTFSTGLVALGKTLGPTITQMLQQAVGSGFETGIGNALIDAGSSIRDDFKQYVIGPMGDAVKGLPAEIQKLLGIKTDKSGKPTSAKSPTETARTKAEHSFNTAIKTAETARSKAETDMVAVIKKAASAATGHHATSASHAKTGATHAATAANHTKTAASATKTASTAHLDAIKKATLDRTTIEKSFHDAIKQKTTERTTAENAMIAAIKKATASHVTGKTKASTDHTTTTKKPTFHDDLAKSSHAVVAAHHAHAAAVKKTTSVISTETGPVLAAANTALTSLTDSVFPPFTTALMSLTTAITSAVTAIQSALSQLGGGAGGPSASPATGPAATPAAATGPTDTTGSGIPVSANQAAGNISTLQAALNSAGITGSTLTPQMQAAIQQIVSGITPTSTASIPPSVSATMANPPTSVTGTIPGSTVVPGQSNAAPLLAPIGSGTSSTGKATNPYTGALDANASAQDNIGAIQAQNTYSADATNLDNTNAQLSESNWWNIADPQTSAALTQKSVDETLALQKEGLTISQKQLEALSKSWEAQQATAKNTASIAASQTQMLDAMSSQNQSLLRLLHLSRTGLDRLNVGGGNFTSWLDGLGSSSMMNASR